MKLQCPRCKHSIPAAQLNVEQDVAVCANCDEVFAISDLLAEGQGADVDVTNPPKGAWFRETFDGWETGATTRSWGALFLVPFTCVWSGGSLGGIYGMQIVNRQFNLVQSLFGIPFLLGSFALLSLTTMSICGKIAISVAGDEGRLFSGALGIGRRKRFDWSAIESVKQETKDGSKGSSQQIIALEGTTPPTIRFGGMLSVDRLAFLRDVLRNRLSKR